MEAILAQDKQSIKAQNKKKKASRLQVEKLEKKKNKIKVANITTKTQSKLRWKRKSSALFFFF